MEESVEFIYFRLEVGSRYVPVSENVRENVCELFLMKPNGIVVGEDTIKRCPICSPFRTYKMIMYWESKLIWVAFIRYMRELRAVVAMLNLGLP